MKTKKLDFTNAPSEVMFIFCAKMAKMPIGASIFKDTVMKYPEWFPEDYDYYIKYDSIPKHVHDSYFNELMDFRESLWENEPNKSSGGIMAAIDNEESYIAWSKTFDRLYPIEKKKEKELREKYYKQYGI